MSNDPFESIPVPLKTRELGVTIPRAQYEALMAAAKELVYQHRDYYGKSDGRCTVCEVIDALRAAGIKDHSGD